MLGLSEADLVVAPEIHIWKQKRDMATAIASHTPCLVSAHAHFSNTRRELSSTMDLATQQILSGLTAGESRDSEGGAGGLTNFGNKVKEYWNTVKTEPLAQVRPPHLSCFFAQYRARLVLAEKVFET